MIVILFFARTILAATTRLCRVVAEAACTGTRPPICAILAFHELAFALAIAAEVGVTSTDGHILRLRGGSELLSSNITSISYAILIFDLWKWYIANLKIRYFFAVDALCHATIAGHSIVGRNPLVPWDLTAGTCFAHDL
jgi:hypothetical protein